MCAHLSSVDKEDAWGREAEKEFSLSGNSVRSCLTLPYLGLHCIIQGSLCGRVVESGGRTLTLINTPRTKKRGDLSPLLDLI